MNQRLNRRFGFIPLLASLGCSASQPAGGGLTGNAAGASGGSTANGAPDLGVTLGGAPTIDPTTGDPADAGDGCNSTLDVTYRDFNVGPDFERPSAGDVVRRRLVQAMLGPDRKPVFQDSVGYAPTKAVPLDPLAIDMTWRPTQPVITSAETFKQWYNTTSGVNIEIPKKLKLTETGAGTGIYGYDSSAFFPLGPDEGFGVTPKGNDQGKNFLFTTEIHVLFEYVAGQKFTFRGDDDLWIFVNGKLALDLGSMHDPAESTIDFDAQASDLGLLAGGSYTMDVFHAERHTRGSNFKITTNIACFTPGVVR